MGAGVLLVAALVANRLERMETQPHDSTFAQEATRVISSIVAGLKEVASRPPAALGLSLVPDAALPVLGVRPLHVRAVREEPRPGRDADNLGLALSGAGGFLGGALGLVLAQKWKDRVPPIRLLLASMLALGVATLVFGALVSLAGFAALLFVGFFTFFLGKISADTIMQQAMPDDFRGRAFALFDIAYNLGFIVPAFILSFVWVEDDADSDARDPGGVRRDVPAADARDLPRGRGGSATSSRPRTIWSRTWSARSSRRPFRQRPILGRTRGSRSRSG